MTKSSILLIQKRSQQVDVSHLVHQLEELHPISFRLAFGFNPRRSRRRIGFRTPDYEILPQEKSVEACEKAISDDRQGDGCWKVVF